jgi:DNA-binding MarR family transcriptional regulator
MSSPEQRALLVELSAAYHRAGHLLELALGDDELAADYALYSLLARGGRMTPTRISDSLGYAMSTTVSRINRLVTRGHAERSRNPRDGRSSYVALTLEGMRRWEATREAWLGAIETVRRHLPMSDGEATEALGVVRDALEAAIEDLLERAAEERAA